MIENNKLINSAFNGKEFLTIEEFEEVTVEVCRLPKFFREPLFKKVDANGAGRVSNSEFTRFWRD